MQSEVPPCKRVIFGIFIAAITPILFRIQVRLLRSHVNRDTLWEYTQVTMCLWKMSATESSISAHTVINSIMHLMHATLLIYLNNRIVFLLSSSYTIPEIP